MVEIHDPLATACMDGCRRRTWDGHQEKPHVTWWIQHDSLGSIAKPVHSDGAAHGDTAACNVPVMVAELHAVSVCATVCTTQHVEQNGEDDWYVIQF